MVITGASSKKKAVEVALREFLRAKHREELTKLIGNYEDFALSLEELEKVRNEPWKRFSWILPPGF